MRGIFVITFLSIHFMALGDELPVHSKSNISKSGHIYYLGLASIEKKIGGESVISPLEEEINEQ